MASAVAAERRLEVAEFRELKRSRDRRLTRSGSGPGRGQASLWCSRGFRRTIGRSGVGRNAADRSGTLAPAVEWLWVRPDPGYSGRKRVE